MHKIITWFLKASVACCISLVLISVFCFFYYNLPVHHSSASKATDYSWDKNTTTSRGTEGFAYTKTDSNGYVNTYPLKSNTTDILIMGSSHTEAFNVNYNLNFPYLLNEKLNASQHNLYAYNIGVSGHTLVRCIRNLDDALNTFSPSKYVIIETRSLKPQLKDLEQLYNDDLEFLSSRSSGLLFYLQKFDFSRLMYSQISNLRNAHEQTADKDNTKSDVNETCTNYKIYLENMIKKAGEAAKERNVQLIILYIPSIQIDYNGSVVNPPIVYEHKLFAALCEKYDITLIDMHDNFVYLYKNTLHLPFGFSNTKVGEGHLNKYGHSQIADTLYNYIIEEENK